MLPVIQTNLLSLPLLPARGEFRDLLGNLLEDVKELHAELSPVAK